ncbi:MAG: UDP-N-acetylglucosamine 2-epimerase, partial [Rhodospirillaceae bacterium]
LFVVTFHPVTLNADRGVLATGELIKALGGFPDAAILLTGVNSDPGNASIYKMLSEFVSASRRQRVLVQSLSQQRYLSAMKCADAVIGNSSSGLIEAPALGTPTVNIGDRQEGRLRSPSVIDCEASADDITAAIERALDPAFRASFAGQTPAYGRGGGTAAKIASVLKSADLEQLSVKHFRDIILAH